MDEVGNQTAQIDAVGQTTYFGYDLAGRRVSRSDPEGRVTYWQHSLGGNLTRREHVGDGARRNEYAVPRFSSPRPGASSPAFSLTTWLCSAGSSPSYSALGRHGTKTVLYRRNRSMLSASNLLGPVVYPL